MRKSILAAAGAMLGLALGGCETQAPVTPSISLSASPKVVSASAKFTDVDIVAMKGSEKGAGDVVIEVPVGDLDGKGLTETVTLADGQATVRYTCDVALTPACAGRQALKATWDGVERTINVTFSMPIAPDAGSVQTDAGVTGPLCVASIVSPASHAQFPASGVDLVPIAVSVTGPGGTAAPNGTKVTLSTSRGSFAGGEKSVSTVLIEGAAGAVLVAPTEPGLALVVAEVECGDDDARAEVVLEFTPVADACDLEIVAPLAGAQFPADGETEIPVTALVRGTDGKLAADGKKVTFRTSRGIFLASKSPSEETLSIGGAAAAVLIAPTLAGKALLVAEYECGGRLVHADVPLEFTPIVDACALQISSPANGAAFAADGKSAVAITASVRGPDGQPAVDGTKVTFLASAGTFLSSGAAQADRVSVAGSATASLRAPSYATLSVVTAEYVCGGATVRTQVSLQFTTVSGACALQVVSPAAGADFPATGSGVVPVSVTMTGADGLPIADGTLVTFVTTLSSFQGGAAQVQGVFIGGSSTVDLMAPAQAGLALVVAEAECGGAARRAETVVEFTPVSNACALEITAPVAGSSYAADGFTTIAIVASVRAQDGQPAPDGAKVSFTTSAGKFQSSGSPSTEAAVVAGEATVNLVAPASASPAAVVAEFSCGGTMVRAAVNLTFTAIADACKLEVVAPASGSNYPADGKTPIVITADARSATGGPAEDGTKIAFSTTRGVFVSTAIDLEDSFTVAGQASARLLSPDQPGPVVVVAEYKCGTATVRASVALDFDAAPGACALQVLSPVSGANYPASGADVIPVSVSMNGVDGLPIPNGTKVTFTTTFGTFRDTNQPKQETVFVAGYATAYLVAPNTAGQALIAATVDCGGGTSSIDTVVNFANLNTSLVVTESKPYLVANGADEVRLTVTALNPSGLPYTGPAHTVTFTVTSGYNTVGKLLDANGAASQQIELDPDVTGQVVARFRSGVQGGSAVVHVEMEGTTLEADVQIDVRGLAFVEFVSAMPDTLGVKTSGVNESSLVTFLVKDESGAPFTAGVPVSFTLSSAPGGAGIFPTTTTTDASGRATTFLSSGTVATTVTITATAALGTTTVSADSAPIAIVGAKPNARHFTFGCEFVNIGALGENGIQRCVQDFQCKAYLADRFSNIVKVPKQVTFLSEAGAITPSVTTTDGVATATYRTQLPQPLDVAPLGVDVTPANKSNITGVVEPSRIETFTGLADRIHNPRDGLATIVAATTGEEEFTDKNHNGIYDSDEPFVDQGEPFLDMNDDNIRQDWEPCMDWDQDKTCDAPDGKWNGDTVIWTVYHVVWTQGVQFESTYDCSDYGSEELYSIICRTGSPPANHFMNMPDGASVGIFAIFRDINLNPVNESVNYLMSFNGGVVGDFDGISGPGAGVPFGLERVKLDEQGGRCDAADVICHVETRFTGWPSGYVGSAVYSDSSPGDTDVGLFKPASVTAEAAYFGTPENTCRPQNATMSILGSFD